MNLKTILAAAAAVALSSMATASFAATCTVGSCSTADVDGQFLSNVVGYDINDIVGDGVVNNGDSGDFSFSGSFVQDTDGDGVSVAAFLQSATQGAISNLMFNIITPAGLAASYALDPDVFVDIVLTPSVNPSVITFTLTGTATRGSFNGQDPDINLGIGPAPVPVPAGILLMGTALAGFGVMRRRKKAA